MKEFHGHASARFDVAPRQVFDLIIDVDRLPEWNGAIEAVLERPPVLEESAQGTVKMHPRHMPSWGSVSRAQELDRHNWRFAYETRNANGNPSYTKWTWMVADCGRWCRARCVLGRLPQDHRSSGPGWATAQAPAAARSYQLAHLDCRCRQGTRVKMTRARNPGPRSIASATRRPRDPPRTWPLRPRPH